MFSIFRRRPKTAAIEQPPVEMQNLPSVVFSGFEHKAASDQNGIDLVSGWQSRLPIPGITSGPHDLYNDGRITWLIEQIGSIEGMNILELGPLDGGHTYRLDKHGAGTVLAIEANKQSFLRCVIAKNILGMPAAKFMLGDFRQWLSTAPGQYDLIVASGVLYHMQNPIELLELMAAKTNRIYLWTHHFCDDEMPPGDIRRGAFIGEPITSEWRGQNIRLWKRQYHMPFMTTEFCGGMENDHIWMDRDDIVLVLRTLGFTTVHIGHPNPDGQNGPSRSFLALR